MTGTFGSFCGPTSFHHYPILQQSPKAIYILFCVVIVIVLLSSTLGNIMILSALRRCKSLRPPSKALLCSLALTDLFVGLVVLPLFTAYHLTIILEMPSHYCAIAVIYGRIANFIVGTSITTIATIAIDRYLALHLRMRYREVVKFKRVVCVLALEWILLAFCSGSAFWNARVSLVSGTVAMFLGCLIILLCYLSIHRGLRRRAAQIHQQRNASESCNLNVLRYKKTVHNMLWICGLLFVCYIPYLSSMFATLLTGLKISTSLALRFTVIAMYLNSTLNPVLCCWRIKELKEKVTADIGAFCNFLPWQSCFPCNSSKAGKGSCNFS